jgi:hypothetical protein
MSLKRLVFAIMFIVGSALFLYGSNYYDAVVGWTGVFLVVADICAVAILTVHRLVMTRRGRSRTGRV